METKLLPKLRTMTTILYRSWRVIFGILVPIFLSPLLRDIKDQANVCSYVLLLMVFYWMFEPINLYITALIPVALFPLLGITTTEDISMNYMKPANMMFLGGLIVGIALEHSNLHHRIALKVVVLFGGTIRSLLFGVMFVTMFLSMWINNTATTAMMIPIVDDILKKINDIQNQMQNVNSKQLAITMSNDKTINQQQMKNLRKAFLLSIAYSANIGGTATLTGTGTNLVFQEVFSTTFEKSKDITFPKWMIYAFPSAFITIMAAWMLLYILYARIPILPESGKHIKKQAQRKYEELGPMTFHEIAVMINFIILVLLWFLREPGLFPGWADKLTNGKPDNIKDATPAILITLLLFLIPCNFHQFYSNEPPKQIERLLNWKVVQSNMSWGVILLLGGGFALAHGTKVSGLNDWFSKQLKTIHLDPVITMILLVILSASITEMASNVATANVILPVLCKLAVEMGVNPLKFLIPVTISISFAFMFPVSTPPNAIVFGYLNISVIEMVKPGILMNIIAIGIQILSINTLGNWIYQLNTFPDWAHNSTQINNT